MAISGNYIISYYVNWIILYHINLLIGGKGWPKISLVIESNELVKSGEGESALKNSLGRVKRNPSIVLAYAGGYGVIPIKEPD